MPTIRPGGQPMTPALDPLLGVQGGFGRPTVDLSIGTAQGRNPPPAAMEMVGYARAAPVAAPAAASARTHPTGA